MEAPSDNAVQWQEKTQISEDRREILGKRIVYHLYRIGAGAPFFEMEIATPDERESAALGSDPERAIDIYRAVVKGEVTPCTLKYIIDDCFC